MYAKRIPNEKLGGSPEVDRMIICLLFCWKGRVKSLKRL